MSAKGGQFKPITKDTNTYVTPTISSDGKSLAAIERKYSHTLHVLPAGGFTGATPSASFPQIKNPYSFGWADGNNVYVSEAQSLVRVSVNDLNETVLMGDPNAAIWDIRNCSATRQVLIAWSGHLGNDKYLAGQRGWLKPEAS